MLLEGGQQLLVRTTSPGKVIDCHEDVGERDAILVESFRREDPDNVVMPVFALHKYLKPEILGDQRRVQVYGEHGWDAILIGAFKSEFRNSTRCVSLKHLASRVL